VPGLCYDFSNLDKFLARDDVKQQLNVTNRKWEECDNEVYQKLEVDWMMNLGEDVRYLLESGVNVLVYSGDKDYACNWRGGEKWTNTLSWKHHIAFEKA